MGAGHGHSHGMTGAGGAAQASTKRIRNMVIALAILIAFLVLEATVALWINSLGLLADAGHMLTDVLGMSMGLIALLLARRGSAAAARTFGWHRAEVLTAIANAVLLLGIAAFIMYEAIDRIGDAPDIPGLALILTATAGLLANLVVILLIRGDAKDSIAVRGAYMEVLADAVSSVGVLVAGIAMLVFGWTWADIVVGVLISLWVVPRAIKLAGSALRILTQASPDHVDVEAVRADLAALPGVVGVHDLHIWPMSTTETALTAHLVMPQGHPGDAFLRDVAHDLEHHHRIGHPTIQIETSRADCGAGC